LEVHDAFMICPPLFRDVLKPKLATTRPFGNRRAELGAIPVSAILKMTYSHFEMRDAWRDGWASVQDMYECDRSLHACRGEVSAGHALPDAHTRIQGLVSRWVPAADFELPSGTA
jgi:hypothetical protein